MLCIFLKFGEEFSVLCNMLWISFHIFVASSFCFCWKKVFIWIFRCLQVYIWCFTLLLYKGVFQSYTFITEHLSCQVLQISYHGYELGLVELLKEGRKTVRHVTHFLKSITFINIFKRWVELKMYCT